MPELRVASSEGSAWLKSPTCPRQAAEPPFLEAPIRAEYGASSFCLQLKDLAALLAVHVPGAVDQ